MKKGFGFYCVLIAAIAGLAAGTYFQVIGGTFGLDNTHNGVCYDPAIVILLVAGAVLAGICIALKRYGLASAAVTVAPGAALCLFIYKCYWYVTDVFVGIDEKHGFDPRFITFVALVLAAFLIGEIAVYAKKVKAAKA